MDRRKIGQEQENLVAEYLKTQGYKILKRNFRCPLGEIDLIGYQEGYLIFIEVKYRRTLREGHPEEAVHMTKQRKISKTALWYMANQNISMNTPCRFDVVAVMPEEIRVIPDAFPLRQ